MERKLAPKTNRKNITGTAYYVLLLYRNTFISLIIICSPSPICLYDDDEDGYTLFILFYHFGPKSYILHNIFPCLQKKKGTKMYYLS